MDAKTGREAESEWADWIRLSRSGVQPRRLSLLVQACESVGAIWDAAQEKPGQIEEITERDVKRLAQVRQLDVQADLDLMASLGIRVVSILDREYPPLLREIYDPPVMLYVRGEFTGADELALAIVGTRRCSSYGRLATERLAGDLARRGFTIVSGLALGVDGAAHEAALEQGGRSIGVLACGLDVDYPREHRELKDRLSESGAVISEVPLGTPPKAERFPVRNRIVSGLALGTLVVEAPLKSGSRITANLAVDQGREVFAVPGDINSPLSRGCHALLRDGAHLVETAEDVVAGLNLHLEAAPTQRPPAPADLSRDEQLALSALSFEPRHVDEVIQHTELAAAQVSAALMMLEVKGLIRRFPGSMFVRL